MLQAFPGMKVSLMDPEGSPSPATIIAIMAEHGPYIMRHLRAWASQVEEVIQQITAVLRLSDDDDPVTTAVFQSLCRYLADPFWTVPTGTL